MNTNMNLVRRAALGFTVALALAGCASSPPATPPEIAQRIDAASTRSDHESLVAYYTQEAAKARDVAETHRKMAMRYGNWSSIGNKGGGPNMKSHCTTIAQSNDSIAASYDAMAASHREMAAQAKP